MQKVNQAGHGSRATIFDSRMKSLILGKLRERGAASLNDPEIERCFSGTCAPTKLTRIAKFHRDGGHITERDLVDAS